MTRSCFPNVDSFCQARNICGGHRKCFWKSSETFLVSARRGTVLPRFVTDGQNRRTQCCRHNVSSFCRGLSHHLAGPTDIITLLLRPIATTLITHYHRHYDVKKWIRHHSHDTHCFRDCFVARFLLSTAEPCELFCIKSGESHAKKIHEIAKDGARCTPFSQDLDVCIEGECRVCVESSFDAPLVPQT